ncbi:MAG TPA: FAD-dependent oxidoreductase [Candidatus Acidoferrum sp.]|nr:FAD-dependent oxidoreductase [Candidatus Acidoferrum sp.]
MATKKRILVLGGGFGGVYAARDLERILRPAEASISLINQENYWVYQPLLPEVISGLIGLTDVVCPIRQLCPRTELVMREVQKINLEQKFVTVSPGFRARQLDIPFDYLVIALGSISNFCGTPGMVEHVRSFRTLADAISLRNHLIHALEEAEIEADPDLRRKLMTFVVAGGGFSGVEVIAEVSDFINKAKDNFPCLRREEPRFVLVHAGERILPEMSDNLALFAQKLLAKRGVELRLKDRLVGATSEKAQFKSGLEIPTKTIVSSVPSSIPPVLQGLSCEKENGRLKVSANLELVGFEGTVWALGDCASIKTLSGRSTPPTAQHATREARTVAKNIAAAIRKQPATPFTFEGLGKLGSLGHYSAVAEILGVRISGFLAWLLWRAIYLLKVPSLRQRARIALDWFFVLLFPPDFVQMRVVRETGIARQHFEAGEVVFFEGDLGDNVYIIESGECDVLRQSGGQETHIATLGPGDFFGEMALINDMSRNATIRAKTTMNVLLVSKCDFDTLKSCVPAFGDVFRKLTKERSAANQKSENSAAAN